MFSINFTLLNFGRSFGSTKHYFHRAKQLTKHKFYEIQISKFGISSLLEFSLDTHWWGRDHAGLALSITFLGYLFDFSLYDHRHWNEETGTWEIYDER